MRRLSGFGVSVVFALLCGGVARPQEQAPAPQVSRVIGEVTALDAAAGRITLKTDKGESVAVQLGEKTLYLRVPPGEKDLKKAARITLQEVGQGDRLLARGRLSEDQKTLAAAAVIVMTKADLAAKQQRDREEWQHRGLAGTVSAVASESKQITLSVRNLQGQKTVVVDAPDSTQFRRYAPDSVRFSDARPSTFAEVKVGDHVRVLGDKNEDGTRIKAEQVVSGSFRTIAATVSSVNAAGGEIQIKDLSNNKSLTVRVNADCTMRRLPPMVAAMMARRLHPETAGGAGAAGGPGAPGAAMRAGANRPGGPDAQPPGGPDGTARPNPWAGMRGQVNQGQGGDFQQMLERMPPLTLADLKPGDAVVISSTTGAEPTHVTAISLVAGVEPLLTAAPQGGRQLGGSWNFGDIGFPE